MAIPPGGVRWSLVSKQIESGENVSADYGIMSLLKYVTVSKTKRRKMDQDGTEDSKETPKTREDSPIQIHVMYSPYLYVHDSIWLCLDSCDIGRDCPACVGDKLWAFSCHCEWLTMNYCILLCWSFHKLWLSRLTI